jgi:hypothetical protein
MQIPPTDRKELLRYTGCLAILVGVFLLFMGLVFLVFMGNTARLDCSSPLKQKMNCSLRTSWFGKFPIATQELSGITHAQVGKYCDEDGDCSYRVELVSDSQAVIPLTAFYSTGRSEKQAAVDQINRYIEQPGNENLSLTLSGVSGRIWQVVLPILAGMGAVWLIAAGLRLRRNNRRLT